MMKSKLAVWSLMLVVSVLFAGCQTKAARRPGAAIAQSPGATAPQAPLFTQSKWEALPEWSTLDLTPSWTALLQSCRVLKSKPQWQQVCASTELVDKNDNEAQRKFYEERLLPFQIFNPDGSENGVITGYYEPLLMGSRFKTDRFQYPVYAAPEDMLEIDLGDAYPQLKGQPLVVIIMWQVPPYRA